MAKIDVPQRSLRSFLLGVRLILYGPPGSQLPALDQSDHLNLGAGSWELGLTKSGRSKSQMSNFTNRFVHLLPAPSSQVSAIVIGS